MKHNFGRNMKLFKSQFPPNMVFYKRRVMVGRALTLVFVVSNIYRQQKVVDLFNERWEMQIGEAAASGFDFNSAEQRKHREAIRERHSLRRLRNSKLKWKKEASKWKN